MHGKIRGLWIAVLLTALTIAGCDRGLGRDTVARAGDLRLQVEDAAQILASAQELPNDSSVVRAISEFWVDYALLARVVNREGELDELDLDPLVRHHSSQELVNRLREEVISVDTEISDDDLRSMYEERRPGEEVHARHILLTYPEGATPSQRDSVRSLAEELRDRGRAGEDFGALAMEYSDDVGTASQGGDLQYFGRGMMVAQFEAAAFSLEPGEVSDVVETQFGLHVIRVEDRRRPEFEEIADQFRAEIRTEWATEAENLYLDRVESAANVQVSDGATDLVREVAALSGANLSSRQANRTISTFEGGDYTAGEFWEILSSQPPQLRQQIEMAPDEQIETMIQGLTRDKLLVEDARSRGIEMSPEEIEAFEGDVRQEYREVAQLLGIDSISVMDGESMNEAIHRSILDLMLDVARGESDLVPLGALVVPLRSTFQFEISEPAVTRVVSRVEELRASEEPADSAPIPPAETSDPSEILAPDAMEEGP